MNEKRKYSLDTKSYNILSSIKIGHHHRTTQPKYQHFRLLWMRACIFSVNRTALHDPKLPEYLCTRVRDDLQVLGIIKAPSEKYLKLPHFLKYTKLSTRNQAVYMINPINF